MLHEVTQDSLKRSEPEDKYKTISTESLRSGTMEVKLVITPGYQRRWKV